MAKETTPVGRATNPTLYDILGVERDASPEEIRDAWRDAAGRFEPGQGGSTRQFRLFNEAAEVLLDPARRKEYDASLAADDPVEPATALTVSAAPTGTSEPAGPTGRTTPSLPDVPVPGAAGAAHPVAAASRSRRRPFAAVTGVLGVPILVVVALVAAAAVGLAAYFVVEARQAAAYERALDRAPAAAENAALAVLTYDYESLENDRDAAAKFLTDDYRADYVDTFDKLVSDSATKTKAKVEAEVLASAAMATGSERTPDRVPVLLFVNQTSTSSARSGEPSVALNRVRFDMVEVDGTWLVDGITSY